MKKELNNIEISITRINICKRKNNLLRKDKNQIMLKKMDILLGKVWKILKYGINMVLLKTKECKLKNHKERKVQQEY